jgi:hypothetical protein
MEPLRQTSVCDLELRDGSPVERTAQSGRENESAAATAESPGDIADHPERSLPGGIAGVAECVRQPNRTSLN